MSSRYGNRQPVWPDWITEWTEQMKRKQVEAEERLQALCERAVDLNQPVTFTIEK